MNIRKPTDYATMFTILDTLGGAAPADGNVL